MAIYHFSAQVISRKKGQSAVASSAYRSGDRLHDEQTGETKYYKRHVQPETMILAPSQSPEWVIDRNRLWNEVEKSENRKDSQLAREVNVALPRELSNDFQKELVHEYVQQQFVNKGMVADIAIHRDDKENPHAHIMLTTREISAEGFGKKNREWNNRELLSQWREQWAEHTNKVLERAGIEERISHLSNEAQGLEQLPTIHLGHVAHEMEKRGVQTDRGNINRERQEYNELVIDLQKYREQKQALQKEIILKQEQTKKNEVTFTPIEHTYLKNASNVLKAEPTLENIEKRKEQLDKWENRVNNNSQFLRWKDEKIKEAAEHHKWINIHERTIQKEKEKIESIKFNPFKIKENRTIKAQANQSILESNKNIDALNKKLNYHREKLNFSNKIEFEKIQNLHETNYTKELEKNRNNRQQINSERNTLLKAEMAHKNAFVRQVASKYPNRSEMRYMSYEAAKSIDKINKTNNKIVPINAIENSISKQKNDIKELNKQLNNHQQHEKNEFTEMKISKIEEKIDSKENSLNLLEGIIASLEQANKAMQQDLNQQKQQQKRNKNPGLER